MKARQPELRAIPQFDSGRWKLRLERVPLATDEESRNEHDSCELETLFENGSSYLLVSDFDQTLSFNDSGCVLWDRLMFSEISVFERLRK